MLRKTSALFFGFLFFLSLSFSALPIPASAAGLVICGQNQDDSATGDIDESKPCTVCHFILMGEKVVDWLMQMMIIIAIVVITAMGILYIVSAGDAGMIKTAKGGLTAALVGFALMLGGWLIVNTTLFFLAGSFVAGFSSSGTFTFTCDTNSSAGSSALQKISQDTNTSTTGGDTSQSCTAADAYKDRLNSGGSVCDGTCRKAKCTFSNEVKNAINQYHGSIDVGHLSALICQESGGNKTITGPTGDCGLMQVLFKDVGNTSCTGPKVNLFDPNVNVQEGVKILNAKLSQTNTSYSAVGISRYQMAFASYNCCSNGEKPNDPSNDCNPSTGWKSIPKWACPINPGVGEFNMCGVKAYACDVDACASQYP